MLLRVFTFLLTLPLGLFPSIRGHNAAEAKPGIRNPYITKPGKVMVSAHRSGAGLAPENTMMAVEACLNAKSFGIDIYELDVRITKDGTLVLLHNDTFDATSNAKEVFGHNRVKPSNYTLEDLQKLNMGEHFQLNGKFPFRGLRGSKIPKNLRVASLEDILRRIEKSAKKAPGYIIELKDGLLNGRRAADELHRILKDLGLLKRTIVGTFWPLLPSYMDRHYPDMPRSASILECVMFYVRCRMGRPLGDVKYTALQLPCNEVSGIYGFFSFMTRKVIDYAHQYGIAVQYWTVNKTENVRLLMDLGADAVMTDFPDMAWRVLHG